MSENIPLIFRADPALKAALERAAKEDGRTLSSLLRKIAADWLRANGVAIEATES